MFLADSDLYPNGFMTKLELQNLKGYKVAGTPQKQLH